MQKINASIAIQILPVHIQDSEKIKVIDKVIEYLKSTKLNCFVSPFETVLEGELFELLEILNNCFKICVELEQPELMAYIKVFYNEKGVLTIDEKVKKHSL